MSLGGVAQCFVCLVIIAVIAALGSCQAIMLGGVLAQEAEYAKKIEVLPKYEGLEHKTVAILVDADPATLYEHPSVANTIAVGLWNYLRTNVPTATLLPQNAVIDWQYRTPQWHGMPYSQITDDLNVDRVLIVDIFEYRLHPPGNSWEWEGLCSGNIGVVERGGLDPDSFAEQFDVSIRFPDKTGYGKESLSENFVDTILINRFIIKTAWLFYKHIEPKYPDKAKNAG